MYFLLDLVDELDLSEILIPAQTNDPRGENGYDPRILTLLLIYPYCVGTLSSRKIERTCYQDLDFRVLTGNQQPDHSRISKFRRRNLDALKGLFVQILRFCQKAGMVSLGHVALDGTKVNANASKHKAMSHERMLRAEKQLAQEINALMRKAEILDARRTGATARTSVAVICPMSCVAARTVWSGFVRPVRKWNRRPSLIQRFNARKKLIRPTPRLIQLSKRTHQRLSRRSCTKKLRQQQPKPTPHERRRLRRPRKQSLNHRNSNRCKRRRCPGAVLREMPMARRRT